MNMTIKFKAINLKRAIKHFFRIERILSTIMNKQNTSWEIPKKGQKYLNSMNINGWWESSSTIYRNFLFLPPLPLWAPLGQRTKENDINNRIAASCQFHILLFLITSSIQTRNSRLIFHWTLKFLSSLQHINPCTFSNSLYI